MSNREDGFFLPENASKARKKEAEDARKNRLEIVKAHSQGQVSRRDLVKWGLITSGGLLAPIHGLNPFVTRGNATGSNPLSTASGVPTGTLPSPMFGVQDFSTPMPR
jgi:manganese oxidase